MPGDRIALATVPDEATARLLREALVDGGVEDVDIHVAPGNAYLGRSQALSYEVRVDDGDEARARLVLRDFESESEQAATSQSARAAAHEPDALPDEPRRKKPVVKWGLILLAIGVFGPILVGIIRLVIQNYLERS